MSLVGYSYVIRVRMYSYVLVCYPFVHKCHSYVTVVCMPFFLLAFLCGIRLLYTVYYFFEIAIFRMAQGMDIASFTCDSFHSIDT